jgi:hypothetical protein
MTLFQHDFLRKDGPARVPVLHVATKAKAVVDSSGNGHQNSREMPAFSGF